MGRWSGQGKNGTGGSRPRARSATNDRPADVGPVASHVGLARAILAKQSALRSGELVMVRSMAATAAARPLFPSQLSFLEALAAKVGAVYEEPDVVAVPAGCVSVQPWGALPARPPTRSRDAA